MKKSLGTVLLLFVVICVCCAVAFGFMYDNARKQCINLQEQIGLYQDNEKDLADALRSLRECNNKIKDLESKLNEALADGNAKDSRIEQLTQDLENANADKLTLQNEVTRLQGLLNSYSDLMNQTYSIQFYNGNENHATRAVSKLNPVLGEDDSIATPTRRNCTFIGWGLNENDNATINLTTYEFSQDTILYAKFNEIKYGLFDEEGTVVYTWDELIENHWISNSNAGLDTSFGWEQMVGQLYISDEVTKIDDFSGCAGLTCIKIPESVVTVTENAFEGCNLQTIIIESDDVVKQMLNDTHDENYQFHMDIWQASTIKIRKDVYENNKTAIGGIETNFYNYVKVHEDSEYCTLKKVEENSKNLFTSLGTTGKGTTHMIETFKKEGSSTSIPKDFIIVLWNPFAYTSNGNVDVEFVNDEWVDYAPTQEGIYTHIVLQDPNFAFNTNIKGIDVTISASFNGTTLLIDVVASEAITFNWRTVYFLT